MRDDSATCRVCAGRVDPWCDFGRQPVSQAFRSPSQTDDEYFYRLTIGVCAVCAMVQHVEQVPPAMMFHADYPFRSGTSAAMTRHFERTAEQLIADERLTREGALAVEIGCNDGTMLAAFRRAGVRHLGIDPSRAAADIARDAGSPVLVEFFSEATASEIRTAEGPADVIFSANTISHIADVCDVFRGVATLLAPDGVFVFEDRYVGDIVRQTSFDQIYDEHCFLFGVRSVAELAARCGLELVDAVRIPVHGGSIRYTAARPGARTVSPRVTRLAEDEREQGLHDPERLREFERRVTATRDELVGLLTELRAQGARVVGYGATAKSATVTNFCGIGPDLVEFVCDSTPEKQGLLTPGVHLPVRPSSAFRDPYPDYALLFAWNHAEEILAKERSFGEQGGRWILYVPKVHVL